MEKGADEMGHSLADDEEPVDEIGPELGIDGHGKKRGDQHESDEYRNRGHGTVAPRPAEYSHMYKRHSKCFEEHEISCASLVLHMRLSACLHGAPHWLYIPPIRLQDACTKALK